MEQVLTYVMGWIEELRLATFLRAFLLLAVGMLAARLLGRGVTRLLNDSLDLHRRLLIRRVLSYGVLTFFLMAALHELGFQFGVVLGAAGILTVAIGFASQTSAANLVSGLFLIGERSFSVGDVIRVGSTTGEVLSVDLLSVKLRTFDNLLVRVPNETLIKSEITNMTRFPIRRIDLPLGVAYKENIESVRDLLLEIADRNPLCLEEPPPLFMVLGFGDSAINLQLSVWGARTNFLALKNSIQAEIKQAFDAASIEIPFPHRALYAGSRSEPLPIRLVESPTPELQPHK